MYALIAAVVEVGEDIALVPAQGLAPVAQTLRHIARNAGDTRTCLTTPELVALASRPPLYMHYSCNRSLHR